MWTFCFSLVRLYPRFVEIRLNVFISVFLWNPWSRLFSTLDACASIYCPPLKRRRELVVGRTSRTWLFYCLFWDTLYIWPSRPIGLWDVEAPTSSRQSAHR
jgi:hypothetical protein